jgi:hypothetical protein
MVGSLSMDHLLLAKSLDHGMHEVERDLTLEAGTIVR